MIYRDPPHYLRALTSNTLPQRLAWLDCASTSTLERGLWVDRYKVGAIGTTHWTSKRKERRDRVTVHQLPADLWRLVDEFTPKGRRVVLFAYDLAYQLRISRALIELPELGFRLDKIVLERTASWALFRQGSRSILCCDLKSWTPVDLARIAAAVGLDFPHVRAQLRDAPKSDYMLERRVEIVREAVLQLFAWLSAENLGPFRPTGSGQSYAAYRRRFLDEQLLVHDDVERLQAERVAMWTGRCEAWRHGELTDGPFVEYDLHAAYCTIGAECSVPTIARGQLTRPRIQRLSELAETKAVLADITVETEVPCVPASAGDRTVWPVGRFRTLLWDPELQLAASLASSVQVHRAWVYDKAPALQRFAQWVLDGLGDQLNVHSPIARLVLKHWSRCLVGRLGLRFRHWQRFGQQPDADLRLVTYIDVDEGTSTDLLIAGHDRLILSELTEATESLPQVPGWIMSECRRRLWQAMELVGHDRVIYVDTDSLIHYRVGVDCERPDARELLLDGWALKGTYDRMVVHGPRNLVCQTGRRVSGLPLSARQVAPLEFTGQIMRSIKESMRAGELDNVVTIPRRFVLDAPDLRRQHLAGGETIPYRLEDRCS